MTLRVAAILAVVFWVAFVVRQSFLARRLLVLETRAGKLVSARGRVPRDLVRDLVDVLERARASCVVEIRKDGRKFASVVVRRGELDGNARQQLRNIVGRVPRARLEAGPKFSRTKV